MSSPSAPRKPKASTSDLLTWSESPLPPSSSAVSTPRSHQPSDGISKALFGGQITEEEAESLNKRKPCSGYKLKEITGNKIFGAEADDETPNSANSQLHISKKTSVRIVQQATKGISQISFGGEEKATPKKPISLPEVAKQRELSGTLANDSDMKTKKQLSDAKCKELSGNDIFGPPPEVPSRPRSHESKANKQVEEPTPPPRNVRTSIRVSNPSGGQSSILFSEEAVVKTTKKIHDQKFAELTGNDIFKGEASHGSAEKPLSTAKLREMSGSNIFADGKVESRDYLGGVRKPPGGESSIALI